MKVRRFEKLKTRKVVATVEMESNIRLGELKSLIKKLNYNDGYEGLRVVQVQLNIVKSKSGKGRQGK